VTSLLHLQSALLGRYAIERLLGRGGMGSVWLARDLHLDRPVAIKVLHETLASRTEERERFLREARIAARLAHPHIVPIYAVVAEAGLSAIVMALIEGETLGARIRRRGPLAPDEAERVIRELAWALAYAHQSGVVHRDLTLENVLLERDTGRALLADFGLATQRDATDAEPVFGTPGYLAPEVIRGEPADTASDLYALGAVGYTACAGRPPFAADTTGELLARHLVQPAPDLAASVRGVSPRLARAIAACLAKERHDRPADATAFLALLERAPAPVAIAPPLAAWFTRWERFRTIYAIAIPVLAMETWVLVWGYFGSGITELISAAAISTAVTFTLLPFVVHLGAETIALRRLHHRGFGIADIRAAWPHWTDRLERDHRREGLPALPGRVVFDLTAIGAVALLVLFVVIWPLIPVLFPRDPNLTRSVLMWMASNVYLAVMTGIAIGLVAPGFRLSPRGRLRRLAERFWRSPLAGLVTQAAGLGQSSHLAASSTVHRNTELVLGLAIDDLWHALPPPVRDDLDGMPALARTLQHSAEELRHLAAELTEAQRHLGHDEPEEAARLVETLATVTARQRETVTMLERLRLQLLRTLADHRPTADLAVQLERAHQLERDLMADLAGHAAVRRLLDRRRRDRTPGHLTPSPAAA
jgi:serine/threonine-protein kinase